MHARERDRSLEDRRAWLLNSGGDEASLYSGVPHHTLPDLLVTAPLLSHTHSSREPGEGWRIKGRGGADNKREAAVPSHHPNRGLVLTKQLD